MSEILFTLKKPFVWLWRFRYRRGYGVHSPTAFEFITGIIYEKLPYYCYQELEKLNRQGKRHRKIDRLIFRLTNRYQPKIVIEIGSKPNNTRHYILSAKKNIEYTSISSNEDNLTMRSPDMIYMHDAEIEMMNNYFQTYADMMGKNAFIVIEGIGYNRKNKAFWKQIINDERVGRTFDLYDLGIIFFDRAKIKQHYKVNF